MNSPALAPNAPEAPFGATDSARINRSREIVSRLRGSEIYRSYEDAFQNSTGLPLAIRPLGSLQTPLHGTRNLNPFCILMAERNPTCAACLRLQHDVELAAGSSSTTRQCYAGLCESAVPIRVGGGTVAFLKTGQVALHRPCLARFRRAMKQLDSFGAKPADCSELKRTYFATRVVTKGQYESLLRLLSIFAEHLSSLTNQLVVKEASSELPAVAKARAYIAAHQGDEISLGDVARAVNMSSYYFCKTFRRATGLTFKDYLARLRVETVKGLLLNPHKRISEAAFEAGFQSLSQFNRVFRRVAGEAPTEYRARLHGSAFPSSSREGPPKGRASLGHDLRS